MKMFTKLTGLMMMLLLTSAIVEGQSQQVTNTVTNSKPAIAIADQQIAEGILTDQNFNPFASQLEQKTIGGTDALAAWVLPGTNATSQNSRAPSNYWKYQRTVYLVKASELATAGFTSGEVFNAIGFLDYYGGNGTLTGTVDVYMLNTADVAFNASYATWANVAAAFTKVSSATSLTVPIEEGSWMIPFSGGTPVAYAGNSLYIAFDFQSPAGTAGTYPVNHFCDNSFASSLYGARSATAPPATMTVSAFRPATWLSSLASNADIVKVTNIYTQEIDAHPYGVPTPISVQVFNVSGSSATFDVILTGTDGYSQTVNVTVGANTGQTVTFPNWNPAVDGDYSFTATTAAIAGETFTDNNSYLIDVNVNTTEVSYSYYAGPYAYGWTYPGLGIFAEKHYMNGSGIITGAALGIANNAANTGNTVYGVVLDAAGVIVATSPAHVILATELGTVIAVSFAIPPLFTNVNYYVGMLTSAGTVQHYPMMAVTETPIRANGFYNFAATGGTPTAATWRYILGALVAPYVPCLPPTGLFASNITATSTNLNWTSLSGLSDVAFGPTGFTLTGPTHPSVTSPITVTTTPNTGYDFYVRDICSGPIYSPWVGPKTFWTFCEDCPPGGIAEGEAQLPNGSDGTGINGGCAVGDPLLTLPIALGDTYCGQSNTFTNNLGAASRDNDYYYLDLTSPTCIYWHITATIKGNGLYNMTLFNAGNLDCAISAYATYTTTTGCELGTIDVDVPSGHYYLVARVATSTGGLWPYGSGPWQYVMTVNGSQLGAPTLDPVPPAALSFTVPPGGSTTQNFSIGNSGTYPLDYAASTSGTFASFFDEKFDTYAAGVQLALQVADPTKWTTWSAAPGSTEDPYVSTDVAYSGANSVMITGVNDCVHPFPNYTTGSYKISFRMFVPTGFDGYFNTLQLFSGAASEWGMQAYFDAGGAASIDAGGAASATWTFSYDTWFNNELYIDLDGDYAEYWFDGTFIVAWQWSTGAFGGNSLNQLGGNNFYAYAGTQTPKFYFDDYKFEIAGNDWLTMDGGLGVSGTVNAGGPAVNITLGVNAGSYPVGTYSKTINMATNELCGAKNTYSINVTMNVGYALTGSVLYGIVVNNKYMATNTSVTLTPGPTVPTGALGAYDIRPLADGTYALTGATTKAWGGLNSFDATLVARYLGSIVTLTDLQKRAADVNLSNSITSFDGTLIKRRLGSIATPQWTAPNYVFDGPFPSTPLLSGLPIIISGADVTQEFRTLCSGDLNSSYTPPAE